MTDLEEARGATQPLSEALPHAGKPHKPQAHVTGRLTVPLHVRACERAYLASRRAAAGVPPAQPVVGLALSGGGIRSATFALGVLQTLCERGLLPHVDYLSTVSGGGYLGSCLSSYLSHPHDHDTKPLELSIERKSQSPESKADAEQSVIPAALAPANWTAESGAKWGVRPENFPLLQPDPLHHLRTHGDFLILRNMLLSRDVMRVVGTLLTGSLATMGMFAFAAIALSAVLLGCVHLLGGGPLLEAVSNDSTWSELMTTWSALSSASHAMSYAFVVVALGAVLGGIAWLANLPNPQRGTLLASAQGETGDDYAERMRLQRTAKCLLVPIALLFGVLTVSERPTGTQWLLAPMLYSIGVLVSTTLLYGVVLPRQPRAWDVRRRSRLGAIVAFGLYGAAAFGFVAALPIILYGVRDVVTHSAVTAVGSLIASRLLAGGAAVQQPAQDSRRLIAKARSLALKALVPVALFATLITVCLLLIDCQATTLLACVLVALALILLFGLLVDFNRVSPHYFYRDRLAEAYLRTEQRVGEGLELVRDDERLLLADLHGRIATDEREQSAGGSAPRGKAVAREIEKADRACGPVRDRQLIASSEMVEAARAQWGLTKNAAPYHLLVTALNLAGSRDLARRDRKSDHFIFSRLFCGSGTTGYAPTDEYEGGEVELARAMTISGAAAASAAGVHTSSALSFVSTLFNVRLGYWMTNPRHPKPVNWVFWPFYLLREMFGQTTATRDDRVVNLSDGGHTGDNVALVPLLQRRCDLIIVSDAGCDPKRTCDDLASAARIAYVDENVVVRIDTQKLSVAGDGNSTLAYAVGTIEYPQADDGDPDAPSKTGCLLYLKSSLPSGDLPLPVRAYAAQNPEFPHETTLDQFFSDAQFEAYRSLGAALASRMLEEIALRPEDLTRTFSAKELIARSERLDEERMPSVPARLPSTSEPVPKEPSAPSVTERAI